MSILLIGDSILEGTFAYLPAAFAAVMPSATVSVEAHVGATTRYWMEGDQIAGFVDRLHPSTVVLVLGTNDSGSGGPEYEATIARAAAAAGATGARVLWVGPFNTDPEARGRWASIRRVVGESNAIDGLSLVAGLERADDGLHLRMNGYRPLAERLAQAIGRAGAKAPAGGMLLPLSIGAAIALLVAWAWS
jgi:lysophospholipase L1-like esterase